MYFFIHFRKNSRKSSAFWHSCFNGISRRACYLAKKDILIKFFMRMFSQVTVIEPARHFSTFGKKSFCRIVKAAPYVSRLPFGWLFEFSGKRPLFLNQFQTSISEIFSGLLPISFQLVFRSCVLRIHRNIFGVFLKRFSFVFRKNSHYFSVFWQKLLARIFKTAFYVSRVTNRGKRFFVWEWTSSPTLRQGWKILRPFSGIFFVGLWKILCYISSETFWEKGFLQ